MNNRIKTGFLYETSSFLTGVGSVLIVGSRLHDYNLSENPDEIAIASDWKMIGQDVQAALDGAPRGAESPSIAEHERKEAA